MPAIPNFDNAIIERAKLEDYLLDLSHKDGASKAVFFLGFGFRRDAPEELAEALREHARAADAREVASRYGVRYIVEAPIATPSGRRPWVRSVWEFKDGRPRFLTAYPMKAKL
jgi:hypothetical protein